VLYVLGEACSPSTQRKVTRRTPVRRCGLPALLDNHLPPSAAERLYVSNVVCVGVLTLGFVAESSHSVPAASWQAYQRPLV
jgi:hypothetical protein